VVNVANCADVDMRLIAFKLVRHIALRVG